MSRRRNQIQPAPTTEEKAKQAAEATLEAAGSAILAAAGPPLETIGEGMAVLVANLGEHGLAAAVDGLAQTPGTITHAIPPGAIARKLRHMCKLAIDERIVVSTRLCERLTERDSVEDEKKRTAKEYADTLAGLDGTILRLRNQFETGGEEREIDVYDLRDIMVKKIRTHRSDTGELIDERDMRPFELQMTLDEARNTAIAEGRPAEEIAALEEQIKAAAEMKPAADLTEEQNLAATPEEAEAMREARLQQEAADRAAAGEPPAALLSMGVTSSTTTAIIGDGTGSTTGEPGQ